MKFIQERIAHKYKNFVQWIAGKAPKIPIGEVNRQADEITDLMYKESELSSALLILAMELAGMEESGRISDETISKFKDNNRLQWALSVASRLHAGWACSPFSGGMDTFEKNMDEWIKSEERMGRLHLIIFG